MRPFSRNPGDAVYQKARRIPAPRDVADRRMRVSGPGVGAVIECH
jgi:hypothetical protein